LAHIPKGILGENTSNLLGAFIVAQIQQAALSRSSIKDRKPYYLYLDEFQNYTADNISDILSESRKYALSMVLAHQYLEQLDRKIQAAVLNTSGSIVAFHEPLK
jgi:type IV secretory pathway TraG/TraD family ATPase VirD4